ncbi:hypothetical protein FOA52_003246 [Chlamydomonas sp. UWO 241]|nr:hypothetical protein FOA52_003246 [Chlamydomonas sp. UWO 241]
MGDATKDTTNEGLANVAKGAGEMAEAAKTNTADAATATKEAATTGWSNVAEGATGVGGATAEGSSETWTAVKNAAGNVGDAVKHATGFDKKT